MTYVVDIETRLFVFKNLRYPIKKTKNLIPLEP